MNGDDLRPGALYRLVRAHGGFAARTTLLFYGCNERDNHWHVYEFQTAEGALVEIEKRGSPMPLAELLAPVLAPDDAASHYFAGYGLAQNPGSEADAERHFAAAVDLKPTLAPALLYLALLQHRSQKWQSASRWFARALAQPTLHPSYQPQAWSGWAHCQEQLGNFSDAVTGYQNAQAAEKDPLRRTQFGNDVQRALARIGQRG